MFITIEGLEGAGKSSVVKFIAELLQKHNVEFVLTREPGGTQIAEEIRRVVLSHHEEPMAVDTELLLMFASRAQHLDRVIKPALQEGKLVLCDRFTDTSYAYQGRGRQIPASRVAALEHWVQGELRPDLTLVLDVEPEVGLTRAHNTGSLDRIEVEELEFFKRVRSYYLEQLEKLPERYKLVDANQNLEAVEEQVAQLCKQYILGNRSSGSSC